jgi:penicillin-binding protein 2
VASLSRRAFIRSSNTYFVSNGLHYGVQKIAQIGERLHLGERTGLPTRQEVAGTCPKPQTIRKGWSPGETANLCIGQGAIDVTPLQMAVMVAAIANGGKVLWPRLVDRIEPPGPLADEQVLHFPQKNPRDDLGVHPRTLKIIRDAMLADVEDKLEGTGKLAAMDGFRICSKTGTAQVKDTEGVITDHTTWFASYAPYETETEKPRYVVVVMVESGSSGGGTCAPIAKEIYKAILAREKYQNSKPSTLARTP